MKKINVFKYTCHERKYKAAIVDLHLNMLTTCCYAEPMTSILSESLINQICKKRKASGKDVRV